MTLEVGGARGAYATISACLASAQTGQTCLVHAGTYAETLAPPRDGVAIVGAPGERVVVTAADRVTGWQRVGNGQYAAAVVIDETVPPAHAGQSWPGTALFYRGEDVPQAQWPVPSKNPLRPNWATIAAVPVPDTNPPSPATITAAGIPAFGSPGNTATIHIWSGSDPYAEYAGAITAASGGSVSYIPLGAFESNFAQPGGLFYVTGARELLSANTWYYDDAAHILYWMPPADVDPNGVDVRVKTRPVVIDLSGRSNITVSNITILGAGVITDGASAQNVLDRITARALTDTQRPHALAPAPNADLYNSGILLDGTANVLQNSDIGGSTQNGVTVYGSGNVVRNTVIHDVDTFGDGAAGIGIGNQAFDTLAPQIVHDTIYNSGGSAIAVSVEQIDTAGGANGTVKDLDIADNNLFATMQLRVDGAALYACCRALLPNARVHGNWLHNGVLPATVTVPANTGPLLHPTAGIYWDNGAGGLWAYDNVVWASYPDIFIHGDSSAAYPTRDVRITANTTPDRASQCSLKISALDAAANVTATANRLVTQPFLANAAAQGITVAANGPTAAGAQPDDLPGCTHDACLLGPLPPRFPTNLPAAGAAPNCNRAIP